MDPLSCKECREIDGELRKASRAARGGEGLGDCSAQELADWVGHLCEIECGRIRETSDLWKAWRRLQEHRTITGHSLSVLPIPPNAIANPN